MEGPPATSRAPAVVAVVVTRDPGPWFDETLVGLAQQDYENLSILVLVAGGGEDPTDRVAALLPDAFVRRLDENVGFGGAVDEALGMVEGAAFFLLCHDDCAPDPDALHVMVEESYRSNAGVVSPKVVHWRDPRTLLHVGQNVDKTGAVVERVHANEIDAGQHDAVRDVFVAPGGFTLVRADLLRALGGFDRVMVAMGEDLDLSWRAHVAGARVVVAPGARVRHLELVAGGERPVPNGTGASPSLQTLQRRHELRTVLTCYSPFHLLRVLPQAFVLALAEIVAASLVGDRRRVRSVIDAWRWNLSHRSELRARRRDVRELRALSDADVRSLQVRGSARLSTYASRLAHHGIDVAHGLRLPPGEAPADAYVAELGAEPVLTGSVGHAFSEDSDFDELDDLGRRSGRDRFGRRRPRRVLASGRSRLVAWLVTVLVLVIGSRGVLSGGLPVIGQYVPFLSWTTTWHELVSGWHAVGAGSSAPASPAFGLLGILGTLTAGRMGFLQEVLVLGCVPVGAWGLSRLLGPFASPRARLAGVVAYLALPLAWDALAGGRWDGLVAYATTPWIVLHLARASGLEPFGAAPPARASADGAAPPAAPMVPKGRAGRRPPAWRRTIVGRAVALGVLEAVAVAIAPATAVVVVVCALGIAAGCAVAGGWRGGWRSLRVAGGATIVAGALSAPWLVATAAAGRDGLAVFGLAGDPRHAPGWGALLRFWVGPIGGSPLGWLLVAAAVAPLVVARGSRFGWAARLWATGLFGWLLALLAEKAWAVPFAPSPDVVLAPAAVAVAACAGLAVAAFETDVSGYRFGWRQAVAVFSLAAVAAGMLPTVVEAANGRWGMPAGGIDQAVSLPAPAAHGYRVLWLAHPAVLPGGGWSLGPGLAYATSVNGLPTAADLWPPASAGGARGLRRALGTALRGETVELGRLLAPARVRFVVVATALAPASTGGGPPSTVPVPAGLVAALDRQRDLGAVPVSAAGLSVFSNRDLGAPAGSVTVAPRHGRNVLDSVGAGLEIALWAVVVAALLGRRRWLDWWWRPLALRRRDARRRRRTGSPVELTPDTPALVPGFLESDALVPGVLEPGTLEPAPAGIARNGGGTGRHAAGGPAVLVDDGTASGPAGGVEPTPLPGPGEVAPA